jgi:peptide/nickel transport system substrate-binding protein
MSSWFQKFRDYIRTTFRSFSFLERTLVVALCIIVLGSLVGIVWTVHTRMTVEVPAPGGILHEGIVGTPRFINPLLAQTDADRDLTTLLYAGLMRALPGGELIPDLAQSYTVSEDGTTYTFVLRPDIFFHDNTPITADDVVFTIQNVQDPRIESPKSSTWDGVTVTASDAHTVVFTLSRPYTGFLNNTTIGIVPQHIWETVAAEDFRGSSYNERPVGSGPFILDSVDSDGNGGIAAYVLRPFAKYALGQPYLTRVFIHIFGNEKEMTDAFKNDDIDAFRGTDPFSIQQLVDDSSVLRQYPLPRTFGLFFNHNKNEIFTNDAVRKALSYAVNRDEIIRDVLNGFGTPIATPLPPYLFAETPEAPHTLNEARTILEDDGWKRDPETNIYMKKGVSLSFSIKTVNSPELKLAAEILQKQFNDLGAQVSIELFDLAQLNQNVIRSRDYETLLFGQVLSRDGDLYPFWHSSQRLDPGLNVALYTNSHVDATLDELRTTLEPAARKTLYESFVREWQSDIPAIFLYVPDILYVLPERIKGTHQGIIQDGSERFLDTYQWYINTQRIFKIFN